MISFLAGSDWLVKSGIWGSPFFISRSVFAFRCGRSLSSSSSSSVDSSTAGRGPERMSNDVKSQCMIFNLRNCVFRCSMNSPQASSVQSRRALVKLCPCRGSDSYLGCALHEWSMNVSRECEWLTCIDELCHFDLWVQQIWPSERPYRVPCPWWIDSLC